MRKRSLLALPALIVGVALAPGNAVGRSHGSDGVTILPVRSSPNGKVLSPARLNVVAVHPRFAFLVGLRNDAESRELLVTLRLKNVHGASVYTERFGTFLRANQRASVGIRIRHVLFAQRQSLEIRVNDPQHKSSWSAKYPVIFALG